VEIRDAEVCGPPATSLALRTDPARREYGIAAPMILLVDRHQPSQTLGSTARRNDQPLELWRESDGLFYVHGAVNGLVVRFLVDTGASMIVLTTDDAQRVGAFVQAESVKVNAETANGKSEMAKVTLHSMKVGSIGAEAVPAVVAQDGLKVSLLGQNWLSHLRSVRIDGDRMLLQ
jgi:clan AA aspartic protease (TIGR02281 family)